MTDAEPTTRSDLGVVDPLTIPGLGRAGRGLQRLPVLGRVFLALALVDVVARALGLGGLTLFLDPSYPTAFLFFAIPHYSLVLLPVVILARRPDAAAATPLVVRGAVALALVELLSEPVFANLAPGSGPDITGWALLQVVAAFARFGGYVLLGMGLAGLLTFEPRPVLRGLANLGAGVMIAGSVTVVLFALLYPPTDYGFPGMDQMTLLVGIVQELSTVGLAVLGWAILRGTVDARRPAEATYLATAAIVMTATNSFLTLGSNLVLLTQFVTGTPATVIGPVGLGFLGTGVVLVLLVVAFALGLADTSVRIPRRGAFAPLPSDPESEPVRWPSPGGEVPTYRPVERPAAKAAPKRRSRKK